MTAPATPTDGAATPIAIVGIGCRFPGDITDAESFWRVLIDGVDAISEIPADRFDIAKYYDATPGLRGSIVSKMGGFVNQRLDEFDALFFGISRSYADRLDPQQRLLLESSWEAMEDAGLDIVGLQGSTTGVFVGQWVSDFENRLFSDTSGIDFQMAMGTGRYAAAGRVSYAFGFRGPSLSIDAACSSGLASVHLAVRSLRSGDCSVALAGGVNMILQPHIHLAYSASKLLSPDGRCRFGDANGKGYVRAEGVGVVVLKPLADALAAGDRVYAVIRGSAVNNDGDSSGAMGRPSRIGQEELLRGALRDAGVHASLLGYVEAHGTGTPAGDPVEVSALSTVLAEGRPAGAPKAWIGSVKTNFGHTEAAAGVAGLIKAALMVQRGMIPPSLHFTTPNPAVAWDEAPLAVATTLMPWPLLDGKRYAGVSSYGIGGTNAHVVIESAPLVVSAQLAPDPVVEAPLLLLPLSARSAEGLRALALRYAVRVDGLDAAAASAVCWSAATRRSALSHRAAFVARDAGELRDALRTFATGAPATAEGIVHDVIPRRVAFVVPGQGAQWVGMARELAAHEPVFRAALEACDAAARAYAPWSLLEQLHLEGTDARFIGDRIDVIQPTLVALAIAYAAWLRSRGLEPDAVVGHSLGEVGAAAIAGVFDIPTAMRIICRRSALMHRTSGQGAMAVVELSRAETEARLAGFESRVVVAVSNSPQSTVISGDPDAVQRLLAALERDGVFGRLVKVDVASHSAQMDALVPELVSSLADLAPTHAAVPLYSSVRAAAIDGTLLRDEYWGRNLRETVRFGETVERLLTDGISAFVELGPHRVLTQAIGQTARAVGTSYVAVASGDRDSGEQRAAYSVFATLWVAGVRIDWPRVMSWGGEVVSLPLYPWQRERYWYDGAASRRAGRSSTRSRADRVFLGERIETAANGGGMEWEVQFDGEHARWMGDHVVRGAAIVPAAAILNALAAAVDDALRTAAPQDDARDVELRDVQLDEAIPLRAEMPSLRIVSTEVAPAQLALQLRVLEDGHWRVIARGTGRRVERSAPAPFARPDDTGAVVVTDRESHYRAMRLRQLDYGPAFQVVSALRPLDGSAEATLAARGKAMERRSTVLLDGALQSLLSFAPLSIAAPHETLVPVHVARAVIRLGGWPDTVTGIVTPAASDAASEHTGDLELRDESGVLFALATGVRMRVVRGDPRDDFSALRLHETWTPVASDGVANSARGGWLVVNDGSEIGTRVVQELRASGENVVEWTLDDALSASRDIPVGTLDIVVCTALSAPSDFDGALQRCYDAPLRVMQRASHANAALRSLALVTRGAVAVRGDADVTSALQAAAWGLARVARHEEPTLGCVALDLDPAAGAAACAVALVRRLRTALKDSELAWRDGEWRANRIERVVHDDAGVAVPCDASSELSHGAPARALTAQFSAHVRIAGLLDSTGWRATQPEAIAPEQVELRVQATGLNFIDVLVALAQYPTASPGDTPKPGLECAGVVTRIGRDVRDIAVGDRVMAVCEGALGSHAIAHGALVVRIPDGVAMDAASAFPIAFLTAARALEDAARLQPNERVLIHSAAGGVGLAALQIARRCGARVLATAGTPAKRAMLEAMGVEHVFDSRLLAWGDEVMAATDGAGVDVVLNSLAGAALEMGLRVLAPYGRFVEIGKRDIFGETRIGMDVFRKQVVVTAVDLLDQIRHAPVALGTLLHDLTARLSRGELQVLGVTRFAARDVAAAFQAFLPGTHVGKIVVVQDGGAVMVRAAGSAMPVRDDATYLITGGLGELGLRAALQLAQRGARHLLLVGRTDPRTAASQSIATLRASGIEVETVAADISRDDGARQISDRLLKMPALAGIIHAAGVLDDGVLAEQTPTRMRTVAASKVGGVMQLARLPGVQDVDFFVLYSSVAAALGTRGQANYAAANAVLDATAHALRARGIRATSIAFGPFAGGGLAAEGRRLEILRDSGVGALRLAHADAALETLAGSTSAHAIAAVFDAAVWVAAHDSAAARRRFAPLLSSDGEHPATPTAARNSIRDQLALLAGARQRDDAMLDFVRGEVASVLRTTIDRVDPGKALKSLGIDSLAALELRNRLEQSTALRLSGTLIFSYPTAAAIATHLLRGIDASLAPSHAASTADAGSATAADGDEFAALALELEALDDDAVRRLLGAAGDGPGA